MHDLLERLGNLLRAEERAVGAAHGLQPVQVQALAYLAQANRYSDSPVAVADYLGLTKGTVSQTLAVLAERGLIAGEHDPADGRRVHYRLTAKARRVLQQLPPASLEQALARAGGGKELATALERVLVALQRARGGRTFGVCRTCRHFRRDGGAFQCGLTGEPLASEQTTRLCREHALPDGAAP